MNYTINSVPVRGGQLCVGNWGADDSSREPVLALHGITASHRAFALLPQRLPEHRLIAPDLRGRGQSATVPGPYGMATHADDLVRVLDGAGVSRATVLGHSMGGFVGLVLAHRHPDRVERLVLVDGGLPLHPPDGATADDVLQAVLGPAAKRLSMTFESQAAYQDFWREHPALVGEWNEAIEAYVDYDLAGEPPWMTPRSLYDAVRDDSTDLHTGTDLPNALAALQHPATFLRAERGMFNEPHGLYTADQAAEATQRFGMISESLVTNVNHYTILLTPRGADAVAAAVQQT